MAFLEVTAIANLTRDPETRVTPGGSSVTQFGIAVNKKWKDAKGDTQEEVTFMDAEAWGRSGEAIAKYFSKGKAIYIRGSIRQDSWTDKKTGEKKSKHKIVVERFEFMSRDPLEQPKPASETSEPVTRQPAFPARPADNRPDTEDVPF